MVLSAEERVRRFLGNLGRGMSFCGAESKPRTGPQGNMEFLFSGAFGKGFSVKDAATAGNVG